MLETAAGSPETDISAIEHELAAERARLGRDLHSGVGQALAGIQMNLEILQEFADTLPPAGQAALGRLERLTQEAQGQARALAHRLHPPAWQALPLAPALRRLAEDCSGRFELQLNVDPALERENAVSHGVRVGIYRCAQECLSNVIRHSGASHAELSAVLEGRNPEGRNVRLTVRDNGHGFAIGGCGIGLTAIREHAAALGGTSSIESSTAGTSVVVTLPANEE